MSKVGGGWGLRIGGKGEVGSESGFSALEAKL